jgi:tetratricopeptide (TPR) repeat protein
MKRLLFPLALVAAVAIAFAGTTSHAVARRSSATPSPSPTPVPLPTATPEPPNVAIPRLQAEIRTNPHDQEAMVELAGQYLAINRPDLTLPLTQQLLNAGDKTAQVYFLDGYAQQAQGQLGNAINDLEQASTLDPTNVAVLANLADLYLAINQPQDAERIANRAVTFNKDTPEAYLSLGSVYSAESHYDDARIQFEKAFSLDKTSTKPLFLIAQTYVAQNNIPMALQTIDRALAVDPQSVEALVNRAQLYAKANKTAQALVAFDDAIVAAPTDEQKVEITVSKAAYLQQQHQVDAAAQIYAQLLARYPNVALSYVAYGSFLAVERHQMAQAIVQWNKALSIDPDDQDALRDLGANALQHNEYSKAAGYLKHLTDVAPSAEGYEMLASAYYGLHDYAQQRQACSASFSLKRSAETLSCIASADFNLHKYHEAAQIFDVLDRAAPGFLEQNPALLFIAGKTYIGDRQPAKALGAYRRLLAIVPRGSKAYRSVQQAMNQLSHQR